MCFSFAVVGGICNRLVFNDEYSFLCLLSLDGLVLDELSFGIDDENFIKNKTVKGKKTKKGISIIEDKTIADSAKTVTEKHIDKLIKQKSISRVSVYSIS